MKNRALVSFTLILLAVGYNINAYEPVFSVGASVFSNNGSEDSDSEFLMGFNGDALQRSVFDNGYYSWYAGSDLSFDADDNNEYEDFEMIALDLHLDKGNIAVEGASSVLFSLHNIEYTSYANPNWNAAFIINLLDSLFCIRFDYDGSLIYQESGNEDRIINSIDVQFLYDPSLRFGSSLSVMGGLENYSEYFQFNSSGSEIDTLRNDRFISAVLSFEGLYGYFSDWELSAGIENIDSNANRWLSSEGLEKESEDKTSIIIKGEYNWSPHISLELSGTAYWEYVEYSDRNVLNSNLMLSDSYLSVTETGGSFEAGWTHNNSLYWIFSFSFFRSFSSDPAFDEWGASTGCQVKYSF